MTTWSRSSRCCEHSTSAPAPRCARSRSGSTRTRGAKRAERRVTGVEPAAARDELGASGVGRLQRPHDRLALPAGVRRCHRCAVSLRRASTMPTASRTRMFYTAETHVTHQGEAKALEPLYVDHARARASTTSACTSFIACTAQRRCARRDRRAALSARRYGGGAGVPDGPGGACDARTVHCAQALCRVPREAGRRIAHAAADPGPSPPCRRSSITTKRRDEIALVACRVVAEHGFDQATIVQHRARRRATPPAWSRTISTPSRTSSSPRCG